MAAWFSVLAVLLGRWSLKKYRGRFFSALEAGISFAAARVGIMAMSMLLLGLAGLWYGPLIMVLCFAATLVSVLANRDLFRRGPLPRIYLPNLPLLDKLLLGMIAAFLSIYFLEAMAPEFYYD